MAKVIIFSGAGVSDESGISTFRDSGGLWEEHKIEDICTAGCMQSNRDETISFFSSPSSRWGCIQHFIYKI